MTMKTAAMLVLGALVLSACGGETPSEKDVGAGLDQWAAQPTGDGSLVGAFKTVYPHRWATMRSQLEVRYAESGGAQGAKPDALNQITTFMKLHHHDMAKAPDADLDALFDEESVLINNEWSVNVETCAHVATTGVQPADDVGKYAADAYADRKLQLKIMRDAADHPTTHKPFAWTPAEQASLDQKFRKDNLKIPKEGMLGADYVVQCIAAVDVDQVVKGFPADRKADFEADLIGKYAAPAS